MIITYIQQGGGSWCRVDHRLMLLYIRLVPGIQQGLTLVGTQKSIFNTSEPKI